jgi:hypothetical protein
VRKRRFDGTQRRSVKDRGFFAERDFVFGQFHRGFVKAFFGTDALEQ